MISVTPTINFYIIFSKNCHKKYFQKKKFSSLPHENFFGSPSQQETKFFLSVASSRHTFVSIRSDQTRPVLALPPVYFGNELTLFGIPMRPFQVDITIPPPCGGMAPRIPRFHLFRSASSISWFGA